MPLKFGTIEQTVFFDALPEEVYDALLDPKKHSEFTGSPATTTARKGATFTAWEGYITGRTSTRKGEEDSPGVGDHGVD